MADADDLAGWLERHGLGALAAKLRAHDLDLGLLPHLTADDLKEAGLSLGQRRRLMLALRSDGAEPTPERRAERRRLSVLFVDLVGSTALAARLDPEETRAVMRAFQNMAAGEIARYQGHLAKFLGDGVLAYFGWPNAHEDDAERAVRAALAIAAEATRLRAPGGEPLVVRAGIATGPVVVEDGSGSGAESETGIAGETPNLAARLQTVAQPGQVVVADATRRLVAGLFELTDLGRHALKGYAEAQPAFAVGGLCTAPTRFEARQADRAPAAMVGRDLEAARLASAWERALAGCGSLVLLSGEAGIGKSRLVSSLEQRLDRPAQLRLRYQCSPFHTNTALWPVMEQISRAAALQASTDGAENIRRLEQLLGQAVAEPQADVELIAHLLGLAREDGPAGMLPPAERKRRLFRSLLAQLDGLAAQRPTLVVLEDAHWIDPTTSELFGLLLPAIDRKPVLVVITYRPEFDPPWRHLGHSTELRLSPLSAIAASVIVSELAPGLSPSLVESIVAKADGVPLFIEEVTRSITESVATGSSQAMLAVPASLHDTLMARLDRLGAARRVAQVGSVIGRAFDHRLLAACIDLPENRLGPALDDLAASGLVSRRGAGTDSSYLFKHALVRDAAYQSLLHSQRRELHARIAHHLAQRNDATAPELLAHHLTAAGQSEPAIQAWRLAAERAVRRSANREAVRHLEQALRLVDERESEVELAIRLQQAVPLIAVHGFGSDEVAGCAARTLELAEASGDGAQRFAALRITWNSGLMREPLPRVLDLAHNLMRQAAGDGARLAIAHRALGYTLCMS
ncbi:MAG: AAA family ATPase, partial [Geminicoccaceae bacterium]